MNYIEQIRGFWSSHDVETYPTNVIALYFYLLEVNNKASWIVSFKRNNSKICADLGISYPTLNNSRNRLKQAGLIDFKTQNGNANVTYTLKNFLKVTNEVSDEVVDEVSNEVSNEVGSRSFKSKDKLKEKTKTKQIEAKASGEFDKTPYWKIFVSIWFDCYQKTFASKPTFNGSAAKNLKSIVDRLQKINTESGQEWTEDIAVRSLNRFLSLALKDEWLRANFLLNVLASKFDSIVIKKENGKQNDGQTRTVSKNR